MTPNVPLLDLNHWIAAAASTHAMREAVLAYHQDTLKEAEQAMTTKTLQPIVDDNASALILAGVQACVLATAALASNQPEHLAIDLHEAARDVLRSWGLRVAPDKVPVEKPQEPKTDPGFFYKGDTLRAKAQIPFRELPPGLEPQAAALIPAGSTMRCAGEYVSGGANDELYVRVDSEVFENRGGWVHVSDVEKVPT